MKKKWTSAVAAILGILALATLSSSGPVYADPYKLEMRGSGYLFEWGGSSVAAGKSRAEIAAVRTENAQICGEAYHDSRVERAVCQKVGDTFKDYRDCLLREKNIGDGPIERHVSCLNEGHRRESALETREAREAKESKQPKEPTQPKEPKEPKQPREGKS